MSRARARAYASRVVVGLVVLFAVSLGGGGEAVAAPSASSIAQKYGLDGVQAGARPWRSSELAQLDRSLAALSSKERRALRGVRFVRGGLARVPQESGLFKWDRRGRRIIVYGRAFTDDKAGPNWTIVHEVGHAITAWPLAVAQAREEAAIGEYNRAITTYNKRISEYNAAVRSFNRGRGDRGAIEAARRKVDAAKRKHEGLRGPALEAKRTTQRTQRQLRVRTPSTGVLAAYREVLGRDKPPTAYGRRSIRESFSEALAMFHCEPKELKRQLPKVHAWFARGEHTRGL